MILDNFYVNQLPALVAQVGDPQFLAGVIGATNIQTASNSSHFQAIWSSQAMLRPA